MKEHLQDKIWIPTDGELGRERIFITAELRHLDEVTLRQLIGTAAEYRNNAYTPYSNYKVGAAILTKDWKIYGGCNSESVAYSPTNHAEGTAIAKAVSEGAAKESRKFIQAIVVSHTGDSGPCGECLQRIVEHADNCLVIISDPNGKIGRITSLKTIFPYNFNPSHLGK